MRAVRSGALVIELRERLLPRFPMVGREHVHSHAAVEAALTAYVVKIVGHR
jgi:hypothetical protein